MMVCSKVLILVIAGRKIAVGYLAGMDKGLVLPALAGLMGNVVLGLLVAYLGVALARTL